MSGPFLEIDWEYGRCHICYHPHLFPFVPPRYAPLETVEGEIYIRQVVVVVVE